jgi:hypothetical protein
MALARVLPNELHERIADFLDPRDAANAAATCRAMRRPYGEMCLWKMHHNVDMHFNDMRNVVEACDALEKFIETNFEKVDFFPDWPENDDNGGERYRYCFGEDDEEKILDFFQDECHTCDYVYMENVGTKYNYKEIVVKFYGYQTSMSISRFGDVSKPWMYIYTGDKEYNELDDIEESLNYKNFPGDDNAYAFCVAHAMMSSREDMRCS